MGCSSGAFSGVPVWTASSAAVRPERLAAARALLGAGAAEPLALAGAKPVLGAHAAALGFRGDMEQRAQEEGKSP